MSEAAPEVWRHQRITYSLSAVGLPQCVAAEPPSTWVYLLQRPSTRSLPLTKLLSVWFDFGCFPPTLISNSPGSMTRLPPSVINDICSGASVQGTRCFCPDLRNNHLKPARNLIVTRTTTTKRRNSNATTSTP